MRPSLEQVLAIDCDWWIVLTFSIKVRTTHQIIHQQEDWRIRRTLINGFRRFLVTNPTLDLVQLIVQDLAFAEKSHAVDVYRRMCLNKGSSLASVG